MKIDIVKLDAELKEVAIKNATAELDNMIKIHEAEYDKYKNNIKRRLRDIAIGTTPSSYTHDNSDVSGMATNALKLKELKKLRKEISND